MNGMTDKVFVDTKSKKLLSDQKPYRYSYGDSLIIASALEHGCTKLISEDMQNGQFIEDRLSISNPFVD
jgi:predicted nucleic acid-binding protein